MGAAALQRQENCEEPNYQRTRMQKDVVIQELKKRGCRITKQRRMLLEVILENECSCCKEIYYNASRLDPGIGSATVYRMVNLLEEIGAISRRNMYKIVRIRIVKMKVYAPSSWMIIQSRNYQKTVLTM